MNNNQLHGAAGSRRPDGRITAVLGPTNTGKTHFAVERMLAHETGMIGLPLRLLAREIYDRVVEQIGAGKVALITGEEKITPPNPRFYVCTVEAMPTQVETAFLAVDEIQLCADPERGHIFTDRLLRARGTEETMLMGAETMRPLIRQLLPDAKFHTRSRFSDLAYTGPKKISRLPRRSAIVAFSADAVYGIAELIRRQRGGAAVVMGALSPRTRNAQVELYQSGEVDFMVATDAIGMGLNMDVDHVAFASLQKFDGITHRPLRATEIAQIAGRAGRHMNDGTFGPTGEASPLEAELVEQIENHRFDPVRILQWRNPNLEFGSIDALLQSLEEVSPQKGLARARATSDVNALKLLSSESDIARMASAPAAIHQLWEVCQIPDFRKTTLEEHVRLLSSIYRHLMTDEGVLPADWLDGHLERLNQTIGDLDTIANRIAHVRTWTYVSNRAGWLDDQNHWQERTRVIEDSLSDALHERLTQRFIDRRTSVLMKRLRENEDFETSISGDGDVLVEGEFVGKLSGFQFVPDPRALATDSGLSVRTLRNAAAKALGGEIAMRAARLSNVPTASIQLTEHGKLWWEGSPIARLKQGPTPLSPEIEILADDTLAPGFLDQIRQRLQKWLGDYIKDLLEPLQKLAGEEALPGPARGLAFQLVESMGAIPRRAVASQLKELDQPTRAELRRLGVRFGEFSVFVPILLKPAAAHLKALLWAVAQDPDRQGAPLVNTLPSPPGPGLTSVPVEPNIPAAYYEAAGFRVCGPRAVRIDMLERLADLLRPARGIENAPKKPISKGEPKSTSNAAPDAAPDATAAEPEATNQPEAATGGESAAPQIPPLPKDGQPTDQIDAMPPATEESASGEPAETSAPDGSPQPDEPSTENASRLPKGAFEISPDMMSLVGCSGDEFAGILRALGYRSSVHKQDDANALTVWRYGKPKTAAKRPQRAASKQATPKNKGKPGKPRRPSKDHAATHAAGRPKNQRREKPIDPDSPFAALASLKETQDRK
jgi:ATP-dependent RNA helicase SUPV3L1/SUV3